MFTKKIKVFIKNNKKNILFYSAWILPGLLFNLIFFSYHAGYQMSYLSGLLILISYCLWKITYKRKLFFVLTIILISIFNLNWFFYNRDPSFSKPYRFLSFHYSEIVKNDIKLGGKIKFIQKNFDPKTTLIVTTALYWRQFSYYLKQYQITDIEYIDTDIPVYKFVIRDTINWDRKEYVRKNLFLDIPSNIKTLVLTDDKASGYVKDYPGKTYKLPGNSFITSISIEKNVRMIYGYHRIEIKNK